MSKSIVVKDNSILIEFNSFASGASVLGAHTQFSNGDVTGGCISLLFGTMCFAIATHLTREHKDQARSLRQHTLA